MKKNKIQEELKFVTAFSHAQIKFREKLQREKRKNLMEQEICTEE